MAAFREIHASVGGAETTTLAAKTPSATAINDTLISMTMVDQLSGTDLKSTGWTFLGKQVSTVGEAQTTGWLWQIAAEAGEKTHTVEWNGVKHYNAGCDLAIKEAHLTEPIAEFKSQSNASSKSVVFPSATVPVANCVSILLAGIDQTGTGTPPAEYTERQDNSIGTYVATRDNPPTGATGELTVTLSVARVTNVAHIIVQPAAAETVPKLLGLLGVGR